MIRVAANFVGNSSDTGSSIPKSDAFFNIKCGEYDRIVVVDWVFSVAFRVSFVGRVGSRIVGNALFRCGNIIFGKVGIHKGVDDALFYCGVC